MELAHFMYVNYDSQNTIAKVWPPRQQLAQIRVTHFRKRLAVVSQLWNRSPHGNHVKPPREGNINPTPSGSTFFKRHRFKVFGSVLLG